MTRQRRAVRWQRPAGEATERIYIRVSKEEHARLRAAGEECGPTVTEWVRQVLLEALDRHERTRLSK